MPDLPSCDWAPVYNDEPSCGHRGALPARSTDHAPPTSITEVSMKAPISRIGATASLFCGLSLAAACGPAPAPTPAVATATSSALSSAAQDLGPTDTTQTVTASLILKVQNGADL